MTKSMGGQRRTITSTCGWTTQGSLREANGKFNIHRKYCDICNKKEFAGDGTFNKQEALENGWKGLNNKRQQIKEYNMKVLTDNGEIKNAKIQTDNNNIGDIQKILSSIYSSNMIK